ncbi:hypothetical protein CKO15_04250 [Halorhodospira abdelmalekii]|uniref:DUF6447 family protein n=1 Tax=Halorhodospira abdelmalekii TaxID=421629 RepID=UPI00190793B5|nr:DUF6447 family protein [Halorhodospira abdelmalekii]MBK1734509.1 hypothetical protein [Halorhodospira abdelmalekii]
MAEQDAQQQTVTIDGKSYNLADLSENARQQLVNIRVAEQEIARLERQLALARTARAAYTQVLAREIPTH